MPALEPAVMPLSQDKITKIKKPARPAPCSSSYVVPAPTPVPLTCIARGFANLRATVPSHLSGQFQTVLPTLRCSFLLPRCSFLLPPPNADARPPTPTKLWGDPHGKIYKIDIHHHIYKNFYVQNYFTKIKLYRKNFESTKFCKTKIFQMVWKNIEDKNFET